MFLLALLFCSSASTQEFDGKIRDVGGGRQEAYMIPPFQSNHASFLELLYNDILVMAWFSGEAEGSNNCSIVVARLLPNYTQWSSATVVSRREGYSNQNPVLFYDSATNLLNLFHSQQKAKDTGKSTFTPENLEDTAQIWTCHSSDGAGYWWSEPKVLFAKAGSYDRNRIIQSVMTSGLIFPIYYSESGIENQYSAVQLNSPDHKNWTVYPMSGSNYLIQPSVIRPVPEREYLVAFFRDKRSQNIYSMGSNNEGYSWTPPKKTVLPNNDAAIQAYMLSSGNMAIVYNPTTGPRNPIRIAISKDGGFTWPFYRDLDYSHKENSDEESVEYSYPSLLQSSDGYIHISYTYNRRTIKYVRIKEDWIYQK